MKKTLILAESPLQLLNSYEAIKFFEIDDYTLLVRYSGVINNDKQLDSILGILSDGDKRVHRIFVRSSSKKIVDYIKILLIKVFSLFLPKFYTTIFTGNYDSKLFQLFIRYFKRNNIYLMDDGNKSIRIQSSFKPGHCFNLFTMFDMESLPGQIIKKNEYGFLRSRCTNFEIVDNIVFFLGSGMSEIDIVSQDYYVSLIKSVSLYYKNQGKSIVYIPHRAEKDDKLLKIAEIDGVNIKYLDYPVELIGLYLGLQPSKVSSFCSTAILTLYIIYGIKVECFHFDYASTADKTELDDIYAYYSGLGIPVVEETDYVA